MTDNTIKDSLLSLQLSKKLIQVPIYCHKYVRKRNIEKQEISDKVLNVFAGFEIILNKEFLSVFYYES